MAFNHKLGLWKKKNAGASEVSVILENRQLEEDFCWSRQLLDEEAAVG